VAAFGALALAGRVQISHPWQCSGRSLLLVAHRSPTRGRVRCVCSVSARLRLCSGALAPAGRARTPARMFISVRAVRQAARRACFDRRAPASNGRTSAGAAPFLCACVTSQRRSPHGDAPACVPLHVTTITRDRSRLRHQARPARPPLRPTPLPLRGARTRRSYGLRRWGRNVLAAAGHSPSGSPEDRERSRPAC